MLSVYYQQFIREAVQLLPRGVHEDSHNGLAFNGISHTTESREPRGVEEAGCKIYSGALAGKDKIR